MSEITPTRSAAMGLREERRAMQEGYVFLDEKCLLLAGAMLQELRRFDKASAALRALVARAAQALAAAVRRHGLQGLQCYPALPPDALAVETHWRSLLGVALVQAGAKLGGAASPEAVYASPEAVYPSPEARACGDAFVELSAQLAVMAAISGNLERLYREYRKSVRRVRALQDVLLPELDRDLYQIEAQLDELERDEALGARWGRGA